MRTDRPHRDSPRVIWPGRSAAGGLFTLLLTAVLVLAAAPALGSSDEAAWFIDEAGTEFLTVVGTEDEDLNARTQRVADFLERRTELATIARFTAGRTWRLMGTEQRADYREALRILVARFLAKRFDRADDPDYTVVRSAELPGNKGFLVTTRLTGTGGRDIRADWRVAEREGAYRIVDVVVEGVSMLVSYRTEISALLESKGGDIDRLIADLQEQSGG